MLRDIDFTVKKADIMASHQRYLTRKGLFHMKTKKHKQKEPNTNNETVKNVVNAALCLALCMVLPFLTGQIPQIGSALSPMHIPALLCGFICGWPYGLIVGFAAPLLRFMLFGMPPLFPYGNRDGLRAGGLRRDSRDSLQKTAENHSRHLHLPDRSYAYRARCLGAVMTVIAGVSQVQFSFQAFLAGAFLNAMPGIICHLILVPIIIVALQKAHFINYEYDSPAHPDALN